MCLRMSSWSALLAGFSRYSLRTILQYSPHRRHASRESFSYMRCPSGLTRGGSSSPGLSFCTFTQKTSRPPCSSCCSCVLKLKGLPQLMRSPIPRIAQPIILSHRHRSHRHSAAAPIVPVSSLGIGSASTSRIEFSDSRTAAPLLCHSPTNFHRVDCEASRISYLSYRSRFALLALQQLTPEIFGTGIARLHSDTFTAFVRFLTAF